MAVVRGDRTAESRKLNRCSVEAQDFYGRFIAVVPDDFGRFRCNATHVFVRMYPRREMTTSALRRVERLMAELEREKLWTTWVVDGVTFAELGKWSPTGNRWHRTPEPLCTFHAHSGACLPSAINRAREWGDAATVEALSRQLKEIRGANADRTVTESGPKGDTPQHSSVPSVPVITDTPPYPPVPGGRVASEPRSGGRTEARRGTGNGKHLAELEAAAVAHIKAHGGTAWRSVRRTLRTWFRSGVTLEEAKARIDRNEHVPPVPL